MPRITRSTTKARRKKELMARKESILAAAEAAFVEDGYQGATYDRMASKAGVSVGTVYNFFGSKEKLYASVIERVGGEMVDYLTNSLLPLEDPDAALERLVRFRLKNFERHRLLLVIFSSERLSSAYPNPESLSIKARKLYYSYLELIAALFEKGMERRIFERVQALNLALSFEGVLDAFVGYWIRPSIRSNLESYSGRIKEAFMDMAGIKKTLPDPTAPEEGSKRREVYVTSFDMRRLRELIAVARAFGSEDNSAHLNGLETELKNSKIVEPSSVPKDVVTMNSRLRIREISSGKSLIRCLAFPLDADDEEENLSILEPLGTALLGERVGEIVEVEISGQRVRFEIEELLYQPESAGDYHR